MATLNIVQGAISGQFILSENIDEYMDLSVLKECPEQKLIYQCCATRSSRVGPNQDKNKDQNQMFIVRLYARSAPRLTHL